MSSNQGKDRHNERDTTLGNINQTTVNKWYTQSPKQFREGLRRYLFKIPTQLFVSGVVLMLGGIILWVAPAEERDGFRGCVRILLGNLESIAIASAVILYFKEIPDRKAQKHYEAWQIIDAASGVKTSYARIKALEDLNRDGVSLRRIALPGANLRGIDLRGADLNHADLRGADLSHADLRHANLWSAKLEGTILISSKLEDANLLWARLSRTKLKRAKGLTKKQLSKAKLCRTKLPDYIDIPSNRDCPPDESAQEPNLSSEQEPEAEV